MISNAIENYDRNDISYHTTELYYYLYFDNQFYIAELEVVRSFNYYKEQVNQKHNIDLYITAKLSENQLIEVNKANRIETNIGRKNQLFKSLKSKIPNLRSREVNKSDYLNSYYNLVGVVYDERTEIEPKTKKSIEKSILQVESQEEKYPPVIIAIAQVISRVRFNQSPQLKQQTIKKIQGLFVS